MICKHCGFKGGKRYFVKHPRARIGRIRVCQKCYSEMIKKRWADGVIDPRSWTGVKKCKRTMLKKKRRAYRRREGNPVVSEPASDTIHVKAKNGFTMNITIAIDPR